MTDKEFLLGVLSDGKPHTLNEILARSMAERGCGITTHSRAADLRRDGHVVLNWKNKGASRGRGSVYQLARPLLSGGSAEPASARPEFTGPSLSNGTEAGADRVVAQLTLEDAA